MLENENMQEDSLENIKTYLDNDIDYESMSAKEMLQRILQKDNGTADVTVGMFLNIYHMKENKVEEVGNASFVPKDLNIASVFEDVLVEITFENCFDVMFNKVNELLGKYRDEINLLSQADPDNPLTDMPTMTMVVMPNKDQGRVVMKAEFPLFWATSSENVMEPPKMMRILYKGEDVEFLGSNEFSMLSVDTDVAIELSKRRNGESEYEARKRKRAELSAALKAVIRIFPNKKERRKI